MMKWIQFLLILFLLPGLPLFQMDQAVDIEWLVCENSLVIKSEINGPFIDHHLCFNSKPPSSFFNQVKISLPTEEPFICFTFLFSGDLSFLETPSELLSFPVLITF